MIGGLKIGDGYQNRPLCRNPKITIQNSDTASAEWFKDGLKLSLIGAPGDAKFRLSLQGKTPGVWYGDILITNPGDYLS